ncbi:MAG: glycoside hydrolase family 25 protein [Oscillospiraceae bacterium]|nr:glycoside hydrolase family 25 protein [Oscillospiraceae bacterium]
MLLLLVGAALWLICFRKQNGTPQPLAGETKYIKLLGNYVPVQQGVAVSEYAAADFSAAEDGRLHYTGNEDTLFGIDVSSHQGRIDWQRVAADGVEFAFLRAGSRGYTEGLLYRDERFEENYLGATKAGIPVGAYFFSQATSVEEAEAEAELLLDILDGRELQYPVVFDWEYVNETARTTATEPQQVSECCLAFCRIIEKAGYQPMVYFNCYTAYLYYDLNLVDEIPFWAAEFTDSPSFYYNYSILQYSCTGSVDGIKGNVDLNIAFCS